MGIRQLVQNSSRSPQQYVVKGYSCIYLKRSQFYVSDLTLYWCSDTAPDCTYDWQSVHTAVLSVCPDIQLLSYINNINLYTPN